MCIRAKHGCNCLLRDLASNQAFFTPEAILVATHPLYTPPLVSLVRLSYNATIGSLLLTNKDNFLSGALPPTHVRAVQDGPTSIRVTWTPPSPLGDTTGYRISYTGRRGGSNASVNIDGGKTTSHTLMGLTSRETYTISIVGTASLGPPSTQVEAERVYLYCKSNC